MTPRKRGWTFASARGPVGRLTARVAPRLLLFVLAGALLTGCYEIEVSLEEDGSGTARIAMELGLESPAAPFDTAAFARVFEAPGVAITRLQSFDVGERRKVWVELSFGSLDQITEATAFTGLDLELARTDDRLSLQATYRPGEPEALTKEPVANRPVRVSIDFPGLVRTANGSFQPTEPRVTWSTTTSALAAEPLRLTAETGLELTRPGPQGFGLLAIFVVLVVGAAGLTHRLRGRGELHVFLFAGGFVTLAFEVLLTRLFSAVLWYHFAFMAISIALLGQGAGASIVTALGSTNRSDGMTDKMGRLLLFTAIAVALTLSFLVGQTGVAASSTLGFAALFILASLPFLFFGAGIARVFSEEDQSAGGLYFANLLGAATGTLVAIPLLSWLGAETAILAVAAVGAAVSVTLTTGASRIMALAVTIVLALMGGTNGPEGRLQLRTGKGGFAKSVYLGLWNSFSYITVGPEFGSSWGEPPTTRVLAPAPSASRSI